MENLLSEKLHNVKEKRNHGDITESMFAEYVQGVNLALKFIGAAYDPLAGEIIETKADERVIVSDFGLENQIAIDCFKSGFYMVISTVFEEKELTEAIKRQEAIVKDIDEKL